MYGVKQNGPAGTENPEKQCRLCLKQSREYYSLKKRFEDTPPVHAVIRTLLSYIEDNHDLPQQVCTACTKELLHFTRVKEGWVANQFALARQYAKAPDKSVSPIEPHVDNTASQIPPEMPEVCVEINEDVGNFANQSEFGAEYSKQTSDGEPAEANPAAPQTPSTSKQPPNQGEVTSAMRRFSKTRLEYRCFVCTTGYNSMKSLLLHLNDHAEMIPHRCTQCVGKMQIFHSVFALNRHLRSHHGSESRKKEVKAKPKPTSCNDCGLVFKSADEKKAHDKRSHFRCETCDQGFTTQSSLNAHMKIHTGVRPHACVYCGKTFSRLFNMKDHMRRHLDDRSHACPICPKMFFNSRQVNNHIESAHGGAMKRSLLVGTLTAGNSQLADMAVEHPRVVINENGLVDFAPDGNDDEDDDVDFMPDGDENVSFKHESDANASNM
uniref:Putative c2h2-type zn-finger protein n=1 Tax=Culex tarsalis TaxID=7177 RepID=A0A1Q3EWA4_CULTA